MATEFSCKFLLYLGSVAKDNDKLLHNQAQLEIGIVHFFSISISEKYTLFFMASSERDESFDFVYFLVFLVQVLYFKNNSSFRSRQ